MEYKIGDWVIVRDWEDMAKEYAMDKYGAIRTPSYYFVSDMKFLCGKVLQVRVSSPHNHTLLTKDGHTITTHMVRPFDITKDLIKGDKIKRVTASLWPTEHGEVGEVYTFERYCSGNGALHVSELGASGSTTTAFEFVERPKTKEGIIMTQFSYQCKSKEEQIMLLGGLTALGYKIHGGDSYTAESFTDRHGIKFYTVVDTKHKTICGDSVKESYNRKYFNNRDEFISEIIKVECKPTTYKDKFIPAMKALIKEYVDGKHSFAANNCTLCATVKEIHGIKRGSLNGEHCRICPWVVITGKTCEPTSDNLKRAAELIEWIKEYEKFED